MLPYPGLVHMDHPSRDRAEWQGSPCLASPSVALTTTSSRKMASWSTAGAETRRTGPLSAHRAHTDRRKKRITAVRLEVTEPRFGARMGNANLLWGAGSEHCKRIAGGAATPRAGPDGGR